MQIVFGILVPFFGTLLGAFMVFFVKRNICGRLLKFLVGFAAGVMIAASIWSLLIPCIELSESANIISWIPASFGFVLGIVFLVVIDFFVNKISYFESKCKLKRTIMMIFVVTLHNIPEGMAVGVVFAGVLAHSELITIAGAMAFAFGIAIQNFPEGAIISIPLRGNGLSKLKSFYYGVLSGVVEPIGAVITIILAGLVESVLPYFLSFAAGAMMYVVIMELIPDAVDERNSYFGLFGVTFGFVIMMILDVSFG